MRAAAGRRQVLALLAAAAAALPGVAAAQQSWAGRYRVAEGPDVVGELVLQRDGRFTYALVAGALDELAKGRWRVNGGVVRLTTQPRPQPPVFSRASAGEAFVGPLRVLVTWPNGRGIAGVDFRIGFAIGEPLTGYTQEDGWTVPDNEVPDPLWIELTEPVHGIVSARFPIEPGQRLLAFVLTPNDLGVVDFSGAAFRRDGSGFVLMHPRGGELRLVRDARLQQR